MSATIWPTLHRFVPSASSELSGYGYELLTAPTTIDEALYAIDWIDCWCPDAARFVLVDAPAEMDAQNCGRLLSAIDESPFQARLHFVCDHDTLAELSSPRQATSHAFSLVIDANPETDIESACQRGALAIRLNGTAIAELIAHRRGSHWLSVLSRAREMGLRCIASQVPVHVDERELFALGFDYASRVGHGLGPQDISHWLKESVGK